MKNEPVLPRGRSVRVQSGLQKASPLDPKTLVCAPFDTPTKSDTKATMIEQNANGSNRFANKCADDLDHADNLTVELFKLASTADEAFIAPCLSAYHSAKIETR